MNGCSPLTSAYGAVAFGVANAIKANPAFAVTEQPALNRADLAAFWDLARDHWDRIWRGELVTNAEVKANVQAFMAERGVSFPITFVGEATPDRPSLEVTMLGMRQIRDENGRLDLDLIISAPFFGSEFHFERINWEDRKA